MERLKQKSRTFNKKSRLFANQAIQYSKHNWHTLSITLWAATARIGQLSCSNEPPTDMEVDLILDMISSYEAKAHRLRTNLASKGTILSRGLAQIKLDRVNVTIARLKRILSPIRRVPFEVLEIILAYSVSDCEYGEKGSTRFYYGLASLPLSQSRVSKFWRYVAFSSPGLWSQIPTIKLDRPYSRTPCFLSFLADVLDRRCGNIPVSFHTTTVDPKSDIVLPHPAMTLLVSHSAKWKTAMLDMSWLQQCELLDIKGRIPLLETLVLSIRRSGKRTREIVDVFQVAPRLREVFCIGGEMPNLVLPKSQLFSYCNYATYYPQCFEYLPRFTSLRTLELGAYFQARRWSSSHVLRLPNLTTLKLITWSGNYHIPLLGILDLPALKNLSVNHRGEQGQISILSLVIDLLLRSGNPPLEKLHVRARFAGEQGGTLTSLLQHIPLVTHLNIDLPHIEDLTRLAQTDSDDDPIAPLLQVCVFFIDRLLTDDEANACRELVHRREILRPSPPLARLRAVYIRFIAPSPDLSDRNSANAQLRLLNGWSKTNASDYLTACKVSIHKHLYSPETVRPPNSQASSSRPRSRDYYIWGIIMEILGSIARVGIVGTQASDIYASGILPTLAVLAGGRTIRLEQSQRTLRIDKYYGICSRLILYLIWKPLLSKFPDDYQWVIRSSAEISYVPSDSPSRKLTIDETTYYTIPIPEIPEADRAWPLADGDLIR